MSIIKKIFSFFHRLFQSEYCPLCGERLARRFCAREERSICIACCNQFRVQRNCPPGCKYALKAEGTDAHLVSGFAESLHELRELTHLQMEDWLERPFQEGGTPLEMAKTDKGRRLLGQFIQQQENEGKMKLDFAYLRKRLGLPVNDESSHFEDVVMHYVEAARVEDWKRATQLFVHRDAYQGDGLHLLLKRQKHFMRSFPPIEKYYVVKSGVAQGQPEAFVEVENTAGKIYTFILVNHEGEWLIRERVLGEIQRYLTRNDVLQQRVFSAFDQKQIPTAMKELQRLIKRFPDAADLYYNLGLAHLAEQEQEKALENFLFAANAQPQYAEAYFNMGTIYLLKKNYEKAKESFETTLTIKHQHIAAYNNLGIVFEAMGELNKAKMTWEKGLKYDPQSEMLHKNIERLSIVNGSEK